MNKDIKFRRDHNIGILRQIGRNNGFDLYVNDASTLMLDCLFFNPVTGKSHTIRFCNTYNLLPADLIFIDKELKRSEARKKIKDYINKPKIKRVIFNNPATIVFWKDGNKTVVKTQGDEVYDPEKGLAMAIAKKMFGNTRDYYEVFNKWIPEKKC